MDLLDSLNKRVIFLKEVSKKMDFDNFNCIHGRAKELAHEVEYREKYDIVVARAVAELRINYLFCSEAKILEVNRSFLQHDYYTDIITFDYSECNFIAGDIYISPETVRSNAALFGTSFDEELLRVIIHGILHLCGQGDKSDIEAAEMRQKENKALHML